MPTLLGIQLIGLKPIDFTFSFLCVAYSSVLRKRILDRLGERQSEVR